MGEPMIYLLTCVNYYEYAHVRGFVVIAKSEKEARELASKQPGFEGEKYWLDKTRSVCLKIDDLNKSRVLLHAPLLPKSKQ